MLRCGTAGLVAWVLLGAATQAQAQWVSFWEGVHRDYHRNAAWPEPFLRPDREAVKVPFSLMIANGVRRQNLISDYHFDDATGQLTLAGESKLRHILTQNPPSRRTIFVQRGNSHNETAQRVAQVQRASSRVIPPGYLADVLESDLPNDGWPADEIDSISRRFSSTRPDPRIKDASSGGGGGGGGSGGGAGGN